MKQQIVIGLTLLSFIALMVYLQITTPTEAGPAGVLIVFSLMYISTLGFLALFFYWGNRLAVRLGNVLRLRQPLQKIRLLHAYYYASVLSLVPIMLMGMASVGEVGAREILLLAVFSVITIVYLRVRIA